MMKNSFENGQVAEQTASVIDFDKMTEGQQKVLDEKLNSPVDSEEQSSIDVDANVDVDDKNEIPTVALEGKTTKVISLKEAQQIENREFKKMFCENVFNTQVSDYRLRNGFDMSGQQKRVLRRKIQRDYDNGKYKRYLNSKLNG